MLNKVQMTEKSTAIHSRSKAAAHRVSLTSTFKGLHMHLSFQKIKISFVLCLLINQLFLEMQKKRSDLWVMGMKKQRFLTCCFCALKSTQEIFRGFFFSQNGETSLKHGAAAHKYKRSKTTYKNQILQGEPSLPESKRRFCF